jgi:hypothetical protein
MNQRSITVNEIMNRAPPVDEISPNMWISLAECGHIILLTKIISIVNVIADESLKAICPWYLIIKLNIVHLEVISAWWRDVSNLQKKISEPLGTFSLAVPETKGVVDGFWSMLGHPSRPFSVSHLPLTHVSLLINFFEEMHRDLVYLRDEMIATDARELASAEVRRLIETRNSSESPLSSSSSCYGSPIEKE